MKKIFLLAFGVLLSGCASQELKPGMIWMYTTPDIKGEKDPDADFGKYQSFAVCPIAELDKELHINPIVEKQLLFLVRNELELLGYHYANTIEQADFYVGVVFANEYKSEYIPPSTSTIPWYVPGQTQTTYMNLYGSTGSHWGTATTTTPGYYVPMTVTRPGRYVGSYYPYLNVVAFDKASKKLVWSGSAIVAAKEPDIRRSASTLLPGLLLGKFSKASEWSKQNDSKNGVFGCGFHIYTIDGDNFYPVITGVWSGSPVSRGSLKVYDTITHIDGQSTLNLPFSKVRTLFDKDQGNSLILTIRRGDKSFEVSLIAEAETKAQLEWQKAKLASPKGEVTMTVKQAQEGLGNIAKNELFDLVP